MSLILMWILTGKCGVTNQSLDTVPTEQLSDAGMARSGLGRDGAEAPCQMVASPSAYLLRIIRLVIRRFNSQNARSTPTLVVLGPETHWLWHMLPHCLVRRWLFYSPLATLFIPYLTQRAS